jgi:ribosomal protein L7/L12
MYFISRKGLEEFKKILGETSTEETRKIAAIKFLRQETGLTLTDSRQIYEEYLENPSILSTSTPAVIAMTIVLNEEADLKAEKLGAGQSIRVTLEGEASVEEVLFGISYIRQMM